MTQPRKHTARLLLAVLAALPGVPVLAFDLDSDVPITVSAGNARLDDAQGVATYTGEVELTQGQTRLTADRVVIHRDSEGLSRIEATGSPAHYRQPTEDGAGETDARAHTITWSTQDRQLTFEGDAVIEQNGNLFRGDTIHYDTARRVVTADGGQGTGAGNGRVEMVIQPRTTRQEQESDGSTQGQ